MGRQPCCEKEGLKRGPWTIEEDHKLMTFILNNGIQCWRLVPKLAGLMRCGKSCRLRWINYLRPDLKRGALTVAEEDMIIELHSRLGNRWSKIAAHFPGRTDNEIKNHWNTRIKKKLKLLGLDPVTHRPIDQTENSTAQSEETNTQHAISVKHEILDLQDTVNEASDRMNEASQTANENTSVPEKSSSHDFRMQLTEGILNSGLNAQKSIMQPLDTFSMVMDGIDQLEDPFQNWIGSPFQWDVLNNMGADFP